MTIIHVLCFLQEDILNDIVMVTKEDTEAFARRAALNTLCAWVDSNQFYNDRPKLYTAINSCIHDLDWEVKRCVLNFWNVHLSRQLVQNSMDAVEKVPEYAAGLMSTERLHKAHLPGTAEVLQGFATHGCFATLVTALSDHDPSVQHNACMIITEICTKLKEISLYDILKQTMTDISHCDDAKERNIHRSSSGMNRIDKSAQQANETGNTKDQPSNKDGPHVIDVTDVINGQSVIASFQPFENTMTAAGYDLRTIAGFLQHIETLDLEELLKGSAQSTDEYARNPVALLEDILIGLKNSEEDETIIDCY